MNNIAKCISTIIIFAVVNIFIYFYKEFPYVLVIIVLI